MSVYQINKCEHTGIFITFVVLSQKMMRFNDFTLPYQGLEMITFIIYNPWLQTSFLLISDYLENPVLEVLSKISTSHNTANIYGSGAGSYW